MMLAELANGAHELGLELNHAQLELFEVYYRELVSWNLNTNLTAITSYQDVQIKHFLDSLTIASALPNPFPAKLSLLDVGTGAGFPGLPLKILCPEMRLTLLEATGKKVAFLKHLLSVLGLADVVVLAMRAEEAAHLPEYRESFEVVTSRAVAELPALLELTLPLCRIGGVVVAPKKGDIQEEIGRSARALEILGGELTGVREITLPYIPDLRYLIVVTKTTLAPSTYPRRPGMPAKKPII